MLLERADRKLRLTDTIAPAPFTPSTPGERIGAAYNATLDAWNLNSEWTVKEQTFDASSDGIFALTGVRLPNPYRDRGGMVDPLPGPFLKGMRADLDVQGYEAEVERLAKTYPDKAAAIRQHGNVLAKAYARRNAAVARETDVLRRSPGAVNVPLLGPVDPLMLTGSIAGSFADPATAAINLAGNVKNGGKLLWSAAKAALINGGAEIAMQPFIKSWADEAGDPYAWSDAGRQVVAAAILGGALDAGARGGFRAVQRGRGLVPETATDGTITGWKRPEDILEDAAKRLPEDSPVRRAAEGDATAAVEVARAVNATEDPAVRGAIDDIEIDAATPLAVPGVDDGTGLLNLAQALRHADDPGIHPPPVRAEPVPEATAPKLADDAPAPGRAFEIDGRPVTYAEVDLKKTAVDPAAFQFKGGGDAAGATERLQGVERWDPIAAGRAVIYERADGTRVIADAHQRRALAMRLKDQETVVPAFIFREADGWRPEDVRALAAKKNLQEGSGSVMDAATVLRERPDILDSSVPLRSEAMRQARSLAKLSDDAFASVKAGVVAPNVGALIGDLVPDKARHGSILDEVAGLDPANAREARLMISELMQTPLHAEEQMTLLGVMRVERSLMKERIKVLDGALQALRQDARIFGLLDREAGRIEEAGNTLAETNAARAQEAAALAETIERLAGQAGPVADWLNASARAVAGGEKPGVVAKAFAKRVADTIERDGFGALFRDPTPLRAGGFDEPGGPDAQAQVARLEMELADDIEIAKKPEIADQRQAVLFSLIEERAKREGSPARSTAGKRLMRMFGYDVSRIVKYLDERISELKASKWQTDQEEAAFFELLKTELNGDPGLAAQIRSTERALEQEFRKNAEAKKSTREIALRDDVKIVRLDDPAVSSIRYEIRDAAGHVIGSANMSGVGNNVDPVVGLVGIAEQHRRRGLASWLYDEIERDIGTKLTPSGNFLTEEIVKFWAKRDRGALYQVMTEGRSLQASEAARVALDARLADTANFDSPIRRTPRALEEWAAITAALREVQQMLPPDVRLRVAERQFLDDLDSEVYGYWDQREKIIAVALGIGDPVRTARHETIHALRQTGLLTDAEFDTMYRFAERFGLREAYEIDKLYAGPYKKAYGHRGDAYIESLLREETVANLFSDAAVNGRRFGDLEGGRGIDKIIDLIRDFLVRLRNALGGLGFRDVRDVFEAIESGAVAARGGVRDTGGARTASVMRMDSLDPVSDVVLRGADVPDRASLVALRDVLKTREMDLATRAFGSEEKAKRWVSLNKRADIAFGAEADRIDAELAKLNDEIVDERVVDEWENTPVIDMAQLNDLIATFGDLEANPLEIPQIIRRYLSDLPQRDKPVERWQSREMIARVVLQKAAIEAANSGQDFKSLTAAVKDQYARQFSDPEDAAFMIEMLEQTMQPRKPVASLAADLADVERTQDMGHLVQACKF